VGASDVSSASAIDLTKTKCVLDSLSAADQAKVAALDSYLERNGCLGIEDAEKIVGTQLFEKLKAAGMKLFRRSREFWRRCRPQMAAAARVRRAAMWLQCRRQA
jgi:hypothetical protein